MKELIICIFSSGLSSIKVNIESTVKSFEDCIGIDDYCYYIFVSNEQSKQYFENILPKKKIFKIIFSKRTFAEEWNYFVNDCQNEFRYVILSHDDLILTTENCFKSILNFLESKKREDFGFITFVNNHYTKNNLLVTNSLREGVHLDRKQSPITFECHNNSINNLDYPKEPVMVYGSLPHLNFISMKSLVKLGECINWSHNSLLIDENFCLECANKKLINVLIPKVFYQHPINGNLRNYNSIIHAPIVHEKFKEKWGVYPEYSDEEVKYLLNKYTDSFLSEFASRKTFDWIYF